MWELDIAEVRLTRRQVVAAGGAAALTAALAGLMPDAAEASPKDVKQKLAELTGGAPLNTGRIAIDVPPYTQYGKQVRIAVSVDSPMSAEDRVEALHILAERNTVPEVASYHFGALAGHARISTRIRVARTQILVVAAEMSDGTFHVGKARCKVARGGGGCG
jgi:sulfur-oxidizing protein SoxY